MAPYRLTYKTAVELGQRIGEAHWGSTWCTGDNGWLNYWISNYPQKPETDDGDSNSAS